MPRQILKELLFNAIVTLIYETPRYHNTVACLGFSYQLFTLSISSRHARQREAERYQERVLHTTTVPVCVTGSTPKIETNRHLH